MVVVDHHKGLMTITGMNTTTTVFMVIVDIITKP